MSPSLFEFYELLLAMYMPIELAQHILLPYMMYTPVKTTQFREIASPIPETLQSQSSKEIYTHIVLIPTDRRKSYTVVIQNDTFHNDLALPNTVRLRCPECAVCMEPAKITNAIVHVRDNLFLVLSRQHCLLLYELVQFVQLPETYMFRQLDSCPGISVIYRWAYLLNSVWLCGDYHATQILHVTKAPHRIRLTNRHFVETIMGNNNLLESLFYTSAFQCKGDTDWIFIRRYSDNAPCSNLYLLYNICTQKALRFTIRDVKFDELFQIIRRVICRVLESQIFLEVCTRGPSCDIVWRIDFQTRQLWCLSFISENSEKSPWFSPTLPFPFETYFKTSTTKVTSSTDTTKSRSAIDLYHYKVHQNK